MLLNVINETKRPFRHRQLLTRVLAAVLAAEKITRKVVVSLNVVEVTAMTTLRTTYLHQAGATDVLAFPTDWQQPRARNEALDLGDIVICAALVTEQARAYRHTVAREWAYLFAHALYHLFGYDHALPATEHEMHAKVEAIMRKINLSR